MAVGLCRRGAVTGGRTRGEGEKGSQREVIANVFKGVQNRMVSGYLLRDILNKIAREHPLVLTSDARVSAPKVMFMAFGESSLDFELRVFIRDVDYRLSVRSDLLFAIDDAFRKEGIEIPFPQRVVHMPTPARPESDESA